MNTQKYYTIEDFESIVIGESTIEDVCELHDSEVPLQVTSYGGFCEFPMEDGGCIRIKFNNEKWTVSDIEVKHP